MGLLYGRVGRLNTKNAGLRPRRAVHADALASVAAAAAAADAKQREELRAQYDATSEWGSFHLSADHLARHPTHLLPCPGCGAHQRLVVSEAGISKLPNQRCAQCAAPLAELVRQVARGETAELGNLIPRSCPECGSVAIFAQGECKYWQCPNNDCADGMVPDEQAVQKDGGRKLAKLQVK
jgi:hypothetical protein